VDGNTERFSYNVLRGTVSGGPYTLLGNAVLPAFSDTNGLVNGRTYYYVVQPINSAGGVICQSNEAAIAIPTTNLAKAQGPAGIHDWSRFRLLIAL
jgi:hypothetical protein